MLFGRREFLAAIAPIFLQRPKANPGPGAMRSDGDPQIVQAIQPLKRTYELPGMTAAIVRPGKPTRVGAVGVRKVGSPQGFGAGDLVHLGSCTKAMTSTMIATLVEEGALSWTATLSEIFP